MADEYNEYEDDFEDDEATPPPTPPSDCPPHRGNIPAPIDANLPDSPSKLDLSPSTSFPWTHITLDELDVESRLAQGAMGAVHAGYYRGRPVAIKTLHDTSSQALHAVEAELLIHASLKNNRRIVELMGANLIPPGCCIVMEQCNCSLFERLHRRYQTLIGPTVLGPMRPPCSPAVPPCDHCLAGPTRSAVESRSASRSRSPRDGLPALPY